MTLSRGSIVPEVGVPNRTTRDIDEILASRHANGGDYWANADGRWGVGAPHSTYESGLILAELGLKPSSPIAKGITDTLFASWEDDGRIRPGPGLAVQPCHTANAARLLCRLGQADDTRLIRTFDWLLANQHSDGGWRCSRARLGLSPEIDASNPGVTLAVLDALRFSKTPLHDPPLERAVDTLLDHWTTRRPLGPCGFGIGSRFMQVEFPYIRYNLFGYVHVLSFYPKARRSRAFKAAYAVLAGKRVEGSVIVEHVRPGLEGLQFCREGQPSRLATQRFAEIEDNLA